MFRIYCRYFTYIIAIFAAILTLSNIFDTSQKFQDFNLPSHLFWRLILYKIPHLINEILPLMSFIAMHFFIKYFTSSHELIIIINRGISIQKILIAPILATILIGIAAIALLNPIATHSLQKYENLHNAITKKHFLNASTSNEKIVFYEQYGNENRIITARYKNIHQSQFSDVTILYINNNNEFVSRINASSGYIDQQNFVLNNVSITRNNIVIHDDTMIIPTDFSVDYSLDHRPPEIIPIFQLKSYIGKVSGFGLPATNYTLYYYKQIYKPLMMVATILIASCFISLDNKSNSHKLLFIYGVIIGFVAYSIVEIASRILIYRGIEPNFAVLAPILLIIFISNFVVLHLKEA